MQVNMQHKDGEQMELSRKDELQRKKRKRGDLPEKEEAELQNLLLVEEAERQRGSMIHNLVDRATKHGRKHLVEVTKKVTSMVAELKEVEKARKTDINNSFSDKATEAKGVASAAINEIQQELEDTLSSLRKSHLKRINEIQDGFRPKFEELETELMMEQDTVATTTAYFSEEIKDLSNQDLAKLEEGGVVEVKVGKTVEFLICPDVEPKK